MSNLSIYTRSHHVICHMHFILGEIIHVYTNLVRALAEWWCFVALKMSSKPVKRLDSSEVNMLYI